MSPICFSNSAFGIVKLENHAQEGVKRRIALATKEPRAPKDAPHVDDSRSLTLRAGFAGDAGSGGLIRVRLA
jgi:hypothetical protein